MKKWKMSFILAIVFITLGNSFASSIPPGIQTQPDETVFTQKLKSAITYLESECGSNGIQRLVILRQKILPMVLTGGLLEHFPVHPKGHLLQRGLIITNA